MRAEPDLSIIVVNWNSSEFLRKCLRSVRNGSGEVEVEVIVVDNASFDGSKQVVADEFPEACFIQSNENLGFSAANNIGYRRSTGRNLLFLNPDTEIVGSALQEMLTELESIEGAGIVGARLLNTDLSIQTSCIQKFPCILNDLLDIEWLRSRFPACRLWDIKVLFGSAGAPAPVDVVSGACLLIKRHVFETVGLFNLAYFMYSDDVDLCWRVQDLGLKTYFVGSATVIHHGGKSTAYTPSRRFSVLMMRHSRLKFLNLSRGPVYGLLYRICIGAAAGCRLLVLGLVWILTLGHFRGSRLIGAFRKWFAVLTWAIGISGEQCAFD